MAQSSKIQIPTISKDLSYAEIRLFLLVLADSQGFRDGTLEQAQKWYKWVTDKSTY